jgi:Phage capsid family
LTRFVIVYVVMGHLARTAASSHRLLGLDTDRSGTALVRAIASWAGAKSGNTVTANEFLWSTDRDTELLLRAATQPATTTTTHWASELGATAVADFLVSMGSASAGSVLLKRAIQLQFGGAAGILVPGVLSTAANSPFVAEASPIPLRALSLDGAMLSPKKFATIVTFTNELSKHSTLSIEVLVRAVLTESVGLALDAALFSNSPADAVRPAGLLLNVNPKSASTQTLPSEALLEDVETLTAGVAGVAGNAPVLLIAAPAQAIALHLRLARNSVFDVLASGALPEGTVMAVSANAVASAVDPTPRFETADEATLVELDSSVPQLGTAGTPNIVGAPAQSLFQTDTLALRLILELSWVMRSPGGIAWLQDVAW